MAATFFRSLLGVTRATLGAVTLVVGVVSHPASAQVSSGRGDTPSPAERPVTAPTTTSDPPATAPSVDPASQAAFEALPEAERRAIQEALIWTGDYASAIDGTFGRGTFGAIQAFERRTRSTLDGILDPRERRALTAAAETARRGVRFTLVDDRTGARIGVPLKYGGRRQQVGPGTRYRGTDDRVTLETDAVATDAGDLATLFERLKADAPGRRVDYSVLRDTWLVVSGEIGTRRFYTRYEAGATGLRGFTFTYERTLGAELDRVAVAIAGTFQAFPGATSAPDALAGPAPPKPTPGEPPARPLAETSTGLAIAPGRVVAAAKAVERCTSLTVAGRPARLAEADAGAGLAVIEAATSAGPPPRLRISAPKPGDDLLVFAYAMLDGGAAVLATAPGHVVAAGTDGTVRVSAPVQPVTFGAVAVDRTGTLVGILATRSEQARAVAGVVPEASHLLVPAGALVRLASLETPASDTADRLSAGAIAAMLTDRVVSVVCAR